ncbi:hypothetical protein [Caenimonas sp. SL110]|uniref:hypothetical protein n=1 Tax=Caenimonas sp. SL110 TaxID=1450524 RepID=UPI000652EA9C|nr:hypothetical protein [Caenimonas sp. SL110]
MHIAKTGLGQQVIKDRSIQLTPRQRSVLILVDGKKTVDQVLTATAAAGVTRDDIERLIELGLLADSAPGKTAVENAAIAAQAEKVEQHKQRSPQERYQDAYPIATRLTAALGLRGFRLNLAVEGATNYEQLLVVAPRIREAVGPDKYAPLDDALNDR